MNARARLRIVGLVVAALIASLAAVPSAGAAGPANRGHQANPFGITVVRFVKGATAIQMRTVVTAAGGMIVTDLGKVGIVAVAPGAQGARTFIKRVRASRLVRAAFVDRVVTASPTDPGDGSTTGSNEPALGSPGVEGPPDPWHDVSTGPFGGAVPGGKLQWDDGRMNVPAAWARTTGDGVRVAVIDSGVQGSHKEILPNYDNRASANTIPCSTLTRLYGNDVVKAYNLKDCSSEDTYGHGTWVASRIVGAANGFASNGAAPKASVIGYKALATGFGGLWSWIWAAMVDACSRKVDLVNMSIGGYTDPSDPEQVDGYFILTDIVAYCRAQGTTIMASAGNEHVRLNRVTITLHGTTETRTLSGVGQVDSGDEGIMSILPGGTIAENDLRGLLEDPAGAPGVVMVSATNNQNGDATGDPYAVNFWTTHVGATDQLTYYSNFGSRIDIAAPGGARRFNVPRIDGGPNDYLRDGWGNLGALDPSGEICTTSLGSPDTFACFKVSGAGFGFLQGTSMSSPNATGAAALILAAHPELKGNPAGLIARIKATARTDMTNWMGPNDPDNTSAGFAGTQCTTGYCHVDFGNPISFSDAYGAGMIDAGAGSAP